MDTLRRVSTNASQEFEDESTALTPVLSNTSTGAKTRPPSLGLNRRTSTTHTLLAANNGNGIDVRRGPQIETTTSATGKASLSMPVPLGRPSDDRRLSASLASVRLPRRSEEGTAALATSPPSSVRSFDDRRQFATSPQVSTTATDTTNITTNSQHVPGPPVLSPPIPTSAMPNDTILVPSQSAKLSPTDSAKAPPMTKQEANPESLTREESTAAVGTALFSPSLVELPKNDGVLSARAPRQTALRSSSNSRRLSRTTSKDNSIDEGRPRMGKVGVCALDVKARSRPSRQILTRLQSDDEFEVIVFGDKVILDEEVENWPICDFLISFFSEGFPLDKAVKYAKLRKPFLVNDLQMQKILWDRRLCLMILDHLRVPTPRRVEVTRDGGPRLESADLAKHVKKVSGVSLTGPGDGVGGGMPRTQSVELIEDGDALLIDGEIIRKPFVEKPVDGEDHNIIIYFPRGGEDGGGARKLFRKVGNKSSEYVEDLIVPRSITEPEESFIYEQFLVTDNSEDVKAYTVGTSYCHAETRKSPVVDGLVRRNTHGKELRYVTKLSDKEKQIASRIARGFGQRICGFDLLRSGSDSYVIDVNGWSFVKDNEDYYNDCARIMKSMFSEWVFAKSAPVTEEPSPSETPIDPQARQSTQHSHRSALKTILKSPSMNRLSSHLPHSRNHDSVSGASSPKGAAPTMPLTSPPSTERGTTQSLPPAPRSLPQDIMPPPALGIGDAKDDIAVGKEADKEEAPAAMPSSKHSWKLKGVVAVIRHADRTPKQKIKFTAHAPEFVDLLKGHHEEVLLKGDAALSSVQAAVRTAIDRKSEDSEKLKNLSNALNRKLGQPDTKVQIKPMFKKRKVEHKEKDNASMTPEPTIPEHAVVQTPPASAEAVTTDNTNTNQPEVHKVNTRSDSITGTTFSRYAAKEEDLVIDKMQLVMKWGGEPTHSARYQSQDLGTNMRDDWKLLNRDVLNDVRLFTSSEKRVKTSAQIWAAAFLGQKDVPEESIQVRKDLLDDSNAAKDVMDKVKKKLKHLLREGNSVPEQFAWPKDVPEPYIVMQNVVDLLKFHRRVMRHNFKKLAGPAAASLQALNASVESKESAASESIDVASVQARWCTGEDAELFKERWEKLFKEFCDTEKADPSKVSELYDTMKYDALHNKQFLEWVFTPSQSIIDEINREEGIFSQNVSPEPERVDDTPALVSHRDSIKSYMNGDKHSLGQKLGLRRRSVLAKPPSTPPLMAYEHDANYFKLFSGAGESRSKHDKRLGRLRELYRYAKILFDYIGPQEYGISDDEKLEIGLLTSLPLLREIVQDLEELQASSNSASFIYFTKESHVYTLLNCIMEGGVHTKIKRATIPELDYLSQICFELYEARDSETEETAYSIRISISPGCHTVDPLDVSLDSKHAIGTAPRRSLTNHQDWRDVISTLKAKFDTVQLPKSFLAVNVSEKHEQEARRASEIAEREKLAMAENKAEVERVEEWKRQVERSQVDGGANGGAGVDGKVVQGEVKNLGTG